MYTIAISNQKGGVGKTTTALNLSYNLAELGRRVLLLDLDPQASLTQALGVNPEHGSLADVLGDAKPGRLYIPQITHKLAEHLDLAPAELSLSNTELYLTARMGRETILKKALDGLNYDYCVIDCGPSLGLLVVNALAAAHGVIAPVIPDRLGLRGLALFAESLESIREAINPRVQFLGALVCQYDKRLTIHQAALAELQAGGQVLPVVIPKRAEAARTAGAGQPVTRGELAGHYKQLAEIIDLWPKEK